MTKHKYSHKVLKIRNRYLEVYVYHYGLVWYLWPKNVRANPIYSFCFYIRKYNYELEKWKWVFIIKFWNHKKLASKT